MTITLYDAFVPTVRQLLGSMQKVLQKAQAWATETGMTDAALANLRLHQTMLPFSFQISSLAHHSIDAIEAAKSGEFDPMGGRQPPATLADMQALVAESLAYMEGVKAAELENVGAVTLKLPNMPVPFAASDFLLSFSQPNFFFHATTAYDILREAGVEIGKRDFLGQLRMKL